MNWDEFLKKSIMDFFIIVTCVTLIIGILGLIYEPQRRFGYEAFFSPLIFGLIGILPTLVTYSKKELTIQQMLIRKALQLLILEGLILGFGYGMGIMRGSVMFSVSLSVLIIFVVVHFISYALDSKQAADLSQELKAFQRH